VKGSVEERRVEAELACFLRGAFGQADLGEQAVAALPGSAQALEVVAIGEPGVGEAVVEAVHIERLGARRRPCAKVEGGLLCGGCERAGGVASPRRVGWGVLRTGMEGHRPASHLMRGADGQLKMDGALRGQRKRSLQGELLDPVQVHVVGGEEGELDKGGTGQEDLIEHHVAGEPGMALQRQAPRE
jgi:hypothetical protein